MAIRVKELSKGWKAINTGSTWGLLNPKGKYIMYGFHDILRVKDRRIMFRIQVDSYWGLIYAKPGQQLRWLIDPADEYVWIGEEGPLNYWPVADRTCRWGFINPFVPRNESPGTIDCKYDDVTCFDTKHKVALVKWKGQWEYINIFGLIAIQVANIIPDNFIDMFTQYKDHVNMTPIIDYSSA